MRLLLRIYVARWLDWRCSRALKKYNAYAVSVNLTRRSIEAEYGYLPFSDFRWRSGLRRPRAWS